MISNSKNNSIISVIAFMLMVSFLFCCGAAWNSMIFGESGMVADHSACGMGDVGDQKSTSHTQFIILSIIDLFNSFSVVLSLVLVQIFLFFFIKFDISYFYLKKIRDKYGGFRLFDNFVNLFRLGILNPKTF